MALFGTYIDSRTISVAATSSTSYTHAIGLVPTFIAALPNFSTATLSGGQPYFSATANSGTVSVANRGQADETWTVQAGRWHSRIY